MVEDIIEFKPGVGPFKLNVNALVRALTRRITTGKAAKGPTLVAKRFIQLFADHGVQCTQIPHFLPQVGLDALSSDEKLLSVLSTSVLDQASELFGVRREWLARRIH